MRPWRLRLTLRRSRIQWALLAVVLLVSVLSATLLSTLYLLASATENFAARSALSDAEPSTIRVVQRVDPASDATSVIAPATEAAADALEGIPFTTSLQVQSGTLAIERPDDDVALGYFAYMDDIDDAAVLRDGRWAEPAPGDTLEVAIPSQLAADQGLAVGDTFTIAPVFQRANTSDVTVVGVYSAQPPGGDFWRFDRYAGAGYIPNAIMPFSGGMVTTDGYGPLLTDLDTLDDFALDSVDVTHLPDFSGVSLAQVEALLPALDELDRTTTGGIAAAGSNIRIVTSVDATLGRVIGSLAVTRSSVLITGLLLLVLSVAALGQTARLMAERRASEQHLMIARGGSGRQVFRLALTEAVAMGVFTAAAAPFAAQYAYQAIASQDAMARAGMNLDPGLPWWTFAVSGTVGLALVVVLVAPLLKRTGTFVDAEQSRSRPGKRAAFQRSGLDVALVVLAGLAYWQLQTYESPVLADGGVAQIDPLLAAGPALALLAGSLVAVRLIPAASKAMEAIAARGRRAVMPLAAWEVGRRSARAVSAILLLTLAVSVGTFAMSYLTTWRLSQDHQAQYQHPADAVVSGIAAPGIVQRSWVDNPDLVDGVSPVIDSEAVISSDVTDAARFQDGIDGRDIQLFATDNEGFDFLAEGRLGDDFGAQIPELLQRDDADLDDIFALPGDPIGLAMDVTASTSATALEDIFVSVRALVLDSNGQYTNVDMGAMPVDGDTHTLRGTFTATEFHDELEGPLFLAGLQHVWTSDDDETPTSTLQQEGRITMTLSVDDVNALEIAQAVPIIGEDPIYDATPVDIATGLTWNANNTWAGVTSVQAQAEQIRAEIYTGPMNLRTRPVSLSQTAEPTVGPVPVVLTSNLMSRLSVEVGDPLRIEISGAVVEAQVQGTSPLYPGASPRQEAVMANMDHLVLAVIQGGAPAPEPEAWWVSLEPENLSSYSEGLPEDSEVTGREALAVSFMEDPLRVATQAALWLVTGAAVALAAVGFAVHAVVTVRARHIEFAQLRAVGVKRGQLLRVVSGEALLLCLLGVAFGVGIGVALGYLVGPLVAVGVDGRPPLPPVLVDIPWFTVGLLALFVAAVLALTVFLVSLMLRRINPAQLLRLGD